MEVDGGEAPRIEIPFHLCHGLRPPEDLGPLVWQRNSDEVIRRMVEHRLQSLFGDGRVQIRRDQLPFHDGCWECGYRALARTVGASG